MPPSCPTPCPQHTHTTCSSDCLPGRPDSGQLIFSSTHRLINTKTPHYSGLMQNNPGKLVRLVTIQAAFSLLTVLFELVAHYIPLSFTCSCSHFPLEATNWSDALRGESQSTANMQTGCQSRTLLKPAGHLAGRGLASLFSL